MANNTAQTDLPRGVWHNIASFVDVRPIDETAPVAELVRYGVTENEILGERIRQHASAVRSSDPVGRFREDDLISRARLVEQTGFVAPAIAQRASVMELIASKWTEHHQFFPIEVEVEDGEVITVEPPFDPVAIANDVFRPIEWNPFGTTVNPWVHRYLLRPVGGERDAEERDGVAAPLRDRRRLLVALKAKLLLMLLGGLLPGTYAASPDQGAPDNKYAALWMLVSGWLSAVGEKTLSVFHWVYLNLTPRFWYYALAPEAQAALDLIVAVLAVFVFFHLWGQWSMELNLAAPARPQGIDRYLGQLVTEKGIVHRVQIAGREYTLSANPEVSGYHEDEMAMPGSEYFPCRDQPIGAILVRTATSDLQLFGTFWRMDDYFITARHCSNTLNQSTATVYLAATRKTKRDNYEINRASVVKVSDNFFDPSNNVMAFYDIDAFACELDQKQWSQIGVKASTTNVRSAYNQQVHTVGFTADGLLVSASGKTLGGSGYECLHHTASTQKGFSGSILLCGNSVIGMHVSAAGEYNVAVRVEMIQYLIDSGSGQEAATKNRKKYTYADASYKEQYRQHKWRGAVTTLKTMRDGKYAVVLENGEATYGWSMDELVSSFGCTGNPEKDADLFEDMLMDSNPVRRRYQQYIDYDDDRYHRNSYENMSVSGMSVSRRGRKRPVKSTPKVAPPAVNSDAWLFETVGGLKPVHGPSAPKLQPEALSMIEAHKEEIVGHGYDEGAFAYPAMTPTEEKNSLLNHLRLFGERVKSIKLAPSKEEVLRCATIVASMMQANAFVPDAGYDTVEGVFDVIQSSIIDPKKSSGYPYCAEGKPTNGQVLQQFGEKGFAQHVINEWNEPLVFKVFEKGEPTKRKKLDAGMPRIITGFPLHATVKHAAILKNFAFALVKNFKRSPVKYAFSPAQPGHLEHLKQVFPGEVWDSDKGNWDFSFIEWIVEVTCLVVQFLANRHPDWDEEKFAKYKQDVREMFDQVFKDSQYRCSDGTLVKVLVTGIMKSGWFGTIAVNSVAQLAIHVMICMRLGLSDDDIENIAIIAGGDDVKQEPAGLDKEAYIAAAADLGVEMEIDARPCLEESEYFSNDIRRGKEGLEFYPQRWTKHIEHLKTIKLEHLPDALCSHMENYRHDAAKFMVLENMYHAMGESHPDAFPHSKLKSRQYLLAKQYGYEHAL